MATDSDDTWYDDLLQTANRFEEENDDLEAILEGRIGFHSFFVADGDDPTRGARTAIYAGIMDSIDELHIDADIVEAHNGEVTPEAVADEVVGQMEQNIGLYLDDMLRENIHERVEKRVRKNMEERDRQERGLDEF